MMGQSTLVMEQGFKQLFRRWTMKHHDLVSPPKDLPPSKDLLGPWFLRDLVKKRESIALLKSL